MSLVHVSSGLGPAVRFALALLIRAAVLALVGLGLVACGNQYRAVPPAAHTLRADCIAYIDGDTRAWDNAQHTLHASTDSDYLYLCYRPDRPGEALQASSTPVTIDLDTDNDPSTGAGGVELRIELSPARDDGRPGNGVRLTGFDAAGNARTVNHADAEFMFAPTYASPAYEMRIARRADLGLADASDLLVTWPSGETFLVAMSDGPACADHVNGQAAGEPYRPIPAAPEGTFRAMSWNVLHSQPTKTPEPFARVIRAVRPDAVLVQEWVDTDTDRLDEWFETNVGGTWYTHKDETWGVAIASRYPLTPADDPIRLRGQEHPVRAARAFAQTPWGDILLVSTHLKCCGGANSTEDQQRMAEAGMINAWIRANTATSAGIVIAGDMNLVGTRRPLDLLGAGIDFDGSELEAVDTPVGWDSAAYTWRDAESRFTPGRLDWMLVSDATLRPGMAFVLDTTKMDNRGAKASRVELTDTDASDHLPIIVDLTPAE